MNILKIINEEIDNLDYRGQHEAPSPLSDDSPMNDVNNVFPDIYTENAIKYYGYDNPYYIDTIRTIQSVKERPNRLIKIYRAVPDINYDIKNKLKPYIDVLNYYNKWKFFPAKNDIVRSFEEKHDDLNWNDKVNAVLNDIYNEINIIKNELKTPLKIENGNWVTNSLEYAKEHGQSNLRNRYKILSKTVHVGELYTDGNDLLEWGYYKK